jgi:hypothetical protein
MPAGAPCRCAAILSVLVWTGVGAWAPLHAQGKSGPKSVNACGVATADELAAALARKMRLQPVAASVPASIGVSVCMWATVDGRKTLSVSTYAPEAVSRTISKDLRTYYESVKSSNANLVRRSPIVFPGVARHASYFVNPRDAGDVILILRQDCVVMINAAGLTREEAQKVAVAAGR